MDVFTAVKGRRSIRKFLKKDIPEDVLDKLVDALIWAPSAGIFNQGSSFCKG